MSHLGKLHRLHMPLCCTFPVAVLFTGIDELASVQEWLEKVEYADRSRSKCSFNTTAARWGDKTRKSHKPQAHGLACLQEVQVLTGGIINCS